MASPLNTAAVSQRLSEIIPSADFYVHAFPILVLFIGAIAALLVGVFRSDPEKPNLPGFGIALISCVVAALVPLIVGPSSPMAYLGSAVLIDSISRLGFSIIALGTLFTLVLASLTNVGRNLLRPELIALLLFSSGGMMMMVCAGEFLSFFTGLEITSVSLYVLVGYQRRDVTGLEAAVKYFLLGATAAATVLLGMALIYLHTGSIKWADLRYLNVSADTPLAVVGVVLFISGLAFKLAIAPFHSWAPDVYQGANSTLTGYMATLVKFSLALVMLRVLSAGFERPSSIVVYLFWGLGTVSIIVGSLFGLVHNSVKRMLAYSSVANAGYFCLAFAALALNPNSLIAKQALTAYAVIYCILSLGAFAVVSWLEEGNREDLLKEELAGIGPKNPFAAAALSVFLFGLAGIPPVAGFFGKFMLINAAVSEGLVGLSIIMVLFSCLSLFYYLSIMVEMWFKPAGRSSIHVFRGEETRFLRWLVGATIAASILIGIVGPRWANNLNYSTAVEKPVSKPAASLPAAPEVGLSHK